MDIRSRTLYLFFSYLDEMVKCLDLLVEKNDEASNVQQIYSQNFCLNLHITTCHEFDKKFKHPFGHSNAQ
jgi:hypothetical protein